MSLVNHFRRKNGAHTSDKLGVIFANQDKSKVKNDVKVHRKPQKFNFLPTFFTYFCFNVLMFFNVCISFAGDTKSPISSICSETAGFWVLRMGKRFVAWALILSSTDLPIFCDVFAAFTWSLLEDPAPGYFVNKFNQPKNSLTPLKKKKKTTIRKNKKDR